MYSYVDSAHMAHHDLKGHTGGFICIDGEIKTNEMWADGLSKPLQGNQFVLFRNQVVNVDIENLLRSVLREQHFLYMRLRDFKITNVDHEFLSGRCQVRRDVK